MRILQVVHKFPPHDIGGTEIYAQSLSRQLSRKHHQVTVFHRQDAPDFGAESVVSEGVKVKRVFAGRVTPLRIFLSTFGNPFVEKEFIRTLDEERPDVVHFQHLMGLSPRLIFLARQRGFPTLLTLHDYWFSCANAQLIRPKASICRGPLLWLNCAHCAALRINAAPLLIAAPLLACLFAYRARLLERALQQVDLLIAPTAFVRRIFLRRGLAPERILHIGHGIETEGAVTRVRRKDGDILHFAYVGGLAWQKGVHILIEAFNGLDPSRARLSIYGTEKAFPEYAQRVHALAKTPNITFQGEVDHDQLWLALADVDLLVVPSLWYETFSLVIQEAFATKVPVIASNLGALREAVRHGVDGLLFPPGDPVALRRVLQELVDTPSLLDGLRDNIEPVKSMVEHAGEIETVYARLVEQKKRPG